MCAGIGWHSDEVCALFRRQEPALDGCDIEERVDAFEIDANGEAGRDGDHGQNVRVADVERGCTRLVDERFAVRAARDPHMLWSRAEVSTEDATEDPSGDEEVAPPSGDRHPSGALVLGRGALRG